MKPPNPTNKTHPYSCPRCNSKMGIQLVTDFVGRDYRPVDQASGDVLDVPNCLLEQFNVLQKQWKCASVLCDWWATVEDDNDQESEEK